MAGRGLGRKRKAMENAEKNVENESVSEPIEPKKEELERIEINRAPVLTLWVAVVAERQGYAYEEGLSFGKAISGILAHSKGRRLGVYEDKDQQDRKRKTKQQQKEKEKFDVFGMRIAGQTTKEGTRLALQNNKPISPVSVESYLRRAFGPYYEQGKEAMRALAKAYPPEKLGSEAYSLYEKIRPQVPGGMKGWGAKGYLDLNLLHQLQEKQEMLSD
jgi:hypothetical protein